MQPEPNQFSSKAPSTKSSQSSQSSSTQHGIHSLQQDPLRSSGSIHGLHDSPDASPSDHSGGVDSILSEDQGLNFTPSNFPGNAAFDSVDSDDLLEGADELHQTQESPTITKASLKVIDLPNEILIHFLSHLSPSDLLSTALVCRQFHRLVTQPDAWRTAFTRYFPGEPALAVGTHATTNLVNRDKFRSDKRAFGRLTTLATWRNEYVVRSRLLRSMERGRPLIALDAPITSARRHSQVSLSPVITHESPFGLPIGRIHALFDHKYSTRGYPVIFAAAHTGEARIFNPITGKPDKSWSTWNDDFTRQRFEDLYPDHAMWGLGAGQFVGNDNPFDISKQYGIVVGEGCPGGRTSLHVIGEHLMHTLQTTSWTFTRSSASDSDQVPCMPRVPTSQEAICSVWLAKSDKVPSLSNGMVGILSGSSKGVVSSYSLGHVGLSDRSMARGQLTARWVVSPGVPITVIAVDEHYSMKRQAQNRVWAVVLNALGEVFYLTKFPKRPALEHRPKAGDDTDRLERLAWVAGRSVHWNLVEPSRRMARPDPYGDRADDGSYSPASSWDGMCLSADQIKAETLEINEFLTRSPAEFRKDCLGWDMQRKMEVDFANDDSNFAGESVAVFSCGLNDEVQVSAKRYVRMRLIKESRLSDELSDAGAVTPRASTPIPNSIQTSSIFGSVDAPTTKDDVTRHSRQDRARSADGDVFFEEWRSSELFFGKTKAFELTCIALDCSKLANITVSEDPLMAIGNMAGDSSGTSSPVAKDEQLSSPQLVPGQRARFIAASTSLGEIYIWNMRGSIPKTAESTQPVHPIRIVYTPAATRITCLAMNSLVVIHGDERGLVQAWDPLASQLTPVRTISTPFTGRTRRRVMEAQAQIPEEFDINLNAAGAIALDTDSTVLRGIVTIGTYVKHWHFRADDLGISSRGRKRKLRKAMRSANTQSGTPTSLPKTGGIHGFIEDELRDLTFEKKRVAKERHRLAERFGVGMLDDEEGLRLAMLMSEESLDGESRAHSERSTPRPESAASARPIGDFDDPDLSEAIRRSLQDSEASSSPVMTPASPSPSTSPWPSQVRLSRRGRRSAESRSGSGSPKMAAGPSRCDEASDLELALMLSMQDQAGASEDVESAPVDEQQFPALASGKGKGKI